MLSTYFTKKKFSVLRHSIETLVTTINLLGELEADIPAQKFENTYIETFYYKFEDFGYLREHKVAEA